MQQVVIKPTSQIFMIQKRIMPQMIDIKILTKFEPVIPTRYKPRQDQLMADITVYTDKAIFDAKMTGKNINPQLTWNQESLLMINQCLNGKRDTIQIKFQPIIQKSNTIKEGRYYNFEMICQIKSGIHLNLFKITLQQNSSNLTPFLHMRRKFSHIDRQFLEKQSEIKKNQELLKTQIRQVQAIQKQITDSSTIEIEYMKRGFIKMINKCKQQIRKYMGKSNRNINGDIITMEQIDQQKQKETQEQRTKTLSKRRILKVNREVVGKNGNREKMEIDGEGQLDSRQQWNGNYQKHQMQIQINNNGKRSQFSSYQDEQSPSSGQQQLQEKDDSLFEKSGIKKIKKTYLEEQQEKIDQLNNGNQDNQGRNSGNWDVLFNDQ